MIQKAILPSLEVRWKWSCCLHSLIRGHNDTSFEVLHAVRYHNVHEGKSITRTVRVLLARPVDHTSDQQKTLQSQNLQRFGMKLMT